MSSEHSAKLAVHLAERVGVARRRYGKRLERCQKKYSPVSVHRLRVETRRLLALLDLLEAARFGCRLKKVRKTFKKRLDAFDELRDTQVQMRLLRPLWRNFPEAQPFRKWLDKREQDLVERLRREIKRMKYGRLDRRLKSAATELARRKDPSLRDAMAAAATLHDAFERVLELRSLVGTGDTAAIHRMRIAFKRFRYMSEYLVPVFPDFTPARLRRMQAFQAAAGDIQDLEILLATLARAVTDGHISAGIVRKLQRYLARMRSQKITAFLAKVDDVVAFRPGAGALPVRYQPAPRASQTLLVVPEALSA